MEPVQAHRRKHAEQQPCHARSSRPARPKAGVASDDRAPQDALAGVVVQRHAGVAQEHPQAFAVLEQREQRRSPGLQPGLFAAVRLRTMEFQQLLARGLEEVVEGGLQLFLSLAEGRGLAVQPPLPRR